MKKIVIILFLIFIFSNGCQIEKNSNSSADIIKYNLIEPGNGIYVITEKDISNDKIKNHAYEAVFYEREKIVKIERHDNSGKLTDKFSVSAITEFYYDSKGNVKEIKYFDRNYNPSEDELFGYWSIEYIYDEHNRVRMEIYRDANSKFLKIPRDGKGNIAKVNFIAPVLTYEYIDDKLKIKALDQNFNLLKEVIGDKPCIPFIDCGESD